MNDVTYRVWTDDECLEFMGLRGAAVDQMKLETLEPLLQRQSWHAAEILPESLLETVKERRNADLED